jgi:hypothetical protein
MFFLNLLQASFWHPIRPGPDLMVIEFTTTYAISAYDH